MLHPEGLHPERGLGLGDPVRRATKLHSTLVKRRTTSQARLDALLEILGPDLGPRAYVRASSYECQRMALAAATMPSRSRRLAHLTDERP